MVRAALWGLNGLWTGGGPTNLESAVSDRTQEGKDALYYLLVYDPTAPGLLLLSTVYRLDSSPNPITTYDSTEIEIENRKSKTQPLIRPAEGGDFRTLRPATSAYDRIGRREWDPSGNYGVTYSTLGKVRNCAYSTQAGGYEFGPVFICKKGGRTGCWIRPYIQLPGSEAVLHRSLSLQLQSRTPSFSFSFSSPLLLGIPTIAEGASGSSRSTGQTVLFSTTKVVPGCHIVKMARDDLASLASWGWYYRTLLVFLFCNLSQPSGRQVDN